ncbi:MAG: DUF3604 domain-containing protein [Candidatus Caldatribacteriota bacterium]
MLKEKIRDDLGKATIKPDRPVRVSSRHSIVLIYYPGAKGIKQGSSVRITIPHPFPTPQIYEFYKDNFVTVSSSREDVVLTLHIEMNIFCAYRLELSHSGAFGKSIFVHLKKGDLQEGDFIKLIYGDVSYYGKETWGPKPPKMPELSGKYEFTIAVDPDAQKKASLTGYAIMRNSPCLEVLPQKKDKIYFIAPSLKEKKQRNFVFNILYLDHFNNPIGKKLTKLKVKLNDKVNNNRYSFANFNIKFNSINKYFFNGSLECYFKKKMVKSITNPVKVGKYLDRYQLFWGDLHAHTAYSDGMGTPEESLIYARDIAGLDFAAITDHDDIGPYLSPEEWENTKEYINYFYQPGEFITFLGYEYRSNVDMNIYYPSKEGKVLCGKDEKYQNPASLNQEIKKLGGMIIPHMHFGADWRGYDNKLYRVMEIYSQHGSAEYINCPRQIPYLSGQLQKGNEKNKNATFQEILASGIKLGVTGGSDSHSGRPGFSNWTRVCRTYQGGLTAVFALEKTRKEIWNAIYRRQCYATTGARIYMEFCINGFPMGSEIKAKKRKLYFSIAGTAPLINITIIKNNKAIFQELCTDLYYKNIIKDEPDLDEDFYYLRVYQKDGEMAWSSPIWVK